MATAIATFTQLAAVDISSAATETTIYTLPANTTAQINSIRMVNRTAATVYVRAWAINDSSTPGENRELLVYDAPVPPGSWLELCDTKIIALTGTSAKIRAQCATASAINVVVSGMETV
jgi:hypothetical protein